MSFLLVTVLTAVSAALPACSWDRPGAEPFMGDVVEAVDLYTDIPADVRLRLKQRVATRQYDEIVTIRRDSISGKQRYRPELRDMQFGNGHVCATVSRSHWSAGAQDLGLVYCEAGICLVVSAEGRNVSRLTRLEPPVTSDPFDSAQGPGGPLAAALGGFVPEQAPAQAPAVVAPAAPTAAADPAPQGMVDGGLADPGELTFDAPGAGVSFSQAAETGSSNWPVTAAWPGPYDPIWNGRPAPAIGSSVAIATVPEPASWALWLLGAVSVAAYGCRRLRS